MECVAIKDKDSGEYYAGCNKNHSKTLLGAQLYKTEKAAINTINKSVNFDIRNPEIVKVVLKEA